MVFPSEISSYLVADSVRREAAFDLENQGLTDGRLSLEVDRIIKSSPFANRSDQPPSTLSGGEEQLLSLTVALQQPHEFFIGQHSFDFLSTNNMQITHEYLLKHGKRMLNITYQAGRTGLEPTIWDLDGECLIARPADPLQPEFCDWSQAVPPWSLTAQAVEKHYKSSDFRLRVPQLALDEIHCLGISGDNGTGKSTFASCLAGLMQFEGQIKVQLPDIVEPRFGYLLQQGRATTHGLSKEDIIQRFVSQGRLIGEQGEYLIAALSELSIYQSLAEMDAYNGCRLVIIAALLFGDYDLVILDEPTYRQPVRGVAEYLMKVANIFGSKPSVIISHDPTFLSHFSDVTIHLDKGVVREKPI